MLQEFGLETLIELDGGRIPKAWQQAVERAALDCDDRPALDKPRKVTLTLCLSPIAGTQGALESVKGTFQIKDSTPTRESKIYDFGFRKLKGGHAQLVFNDLSDDNVQQKTLDEE